MFKKIFKSHHDAGKQLAERLIGYKASDSVLFAVPDGGISIGYEIAKRLKLPLELIMTKKLSDPKCPKNSISVVSETKENLINDIELYVDKQWLEKNINKERKEALKRKKNYYGSHTPVDVRGKTAILVDDGIATGFTLSTAIEEIRDKGASEIIVATPVTSYDGLRSIKSVSDKFVALNTIDEGFGCVGNYYKKFNKFSEEEIMKILSKLWQKK